jgi:hypothetical protein
MSLSSEEFTSVEEEQVAAGPELSIEEMMPEVNVGMAERIASVIGGAAMLAGESISPSAAGPSAAP